MAHKLGKWQTVFGKKCANLSLKFWVLIIGEIEQIFCALATFQTTKNVWWNWPLRTISPNFCKQLLWAKIPKSQKYTIDLTVFFQNWDLLLSKQLVNMLVKSTTYSFKTFGPKLRHSISFAKINIKNNTFILSKPFDIIILIVTI